MLEQNARLILTDSGGMQKEAYFMKVPCITLRPETEWIETVHEGCNVLVATEKDEILNAASIIACPKKQSHLFGEGKAAYKILQNLSDGHQKP